MTDLEQRTGAWRAHRERMVADLPAKYLAWANGDQDAATFLGVVAQIIRVADDIADGDTVDTHDAVARLLHLALVQLPSVAFYRQHCTWFVPIFSAVTMAWIESERLAKSDEREGRMFGYVMREQCQDIFMQVALLTGGYNHARAVAKDFHDFCYAVHEPFDTWEAEHGVR